MSISELKPELVGLLHAARALPPELVRQVAEFAEFLQQKHGASAIEGSDQWSEEDMRELTLASLRRFEAEHPEENWGTEYSNPKGM